MNKLFFSRFYGMRNDFFSRICDLDTVMTWEKFGFTYVKSPEPSLMKGFLENNISRSIS